MVVYVGLEGVVECGGCGGGGTDKLQFRQGFTDVRVFTVVRTSSDVRPFPVVRSLGKIRAREEELRDFREEEDGEVEIDRISGWKRVGRVGKARSTRSSTNPWTKSNKISTHKQITKNLGPFLVGNFRN